MAEVKGTIYSLIKHAKILQLTAQELPLIDIQYN